MARSQLDELFTAPDATLPGDVAGELESIMRIHSLSEQELFFKWEAYSIKPGTDGSTITYKVVRDFKKDLQDALERESRAKTHVQSASKKSTATPRGNASSDLYGVLDGLVSGTPNAAKSHIKRKGTFETPPTKAAKTPGTTSPGHNRDSAYKTTSFDDRQTAGQIIESLNAHITSEQTQPSTEARVKLKANTELAKFNYRPMAMKLSEASEILDDRLDEFTVLVQEYHSLPDEAFGNPAAQGTGEIVAVGRIASDTDGKMNASSLILETSRRAGAGLRIPLRFDALPYDVFPGRVVALRGTNPAGEYFSVSEVLKIPLLPLPASKPGEIDAHNERLGTSAQPLNIMIASGPYTPETDLSYSALHALLDQAAETNADVLILNGPFLDLEHPLIATGDFELPADSQTAPDRATMADAFAAFISRPLSKLAERLPSITIILVPSIRDAVSKHVSWPQDRLQKRELGLPKQVTCVTNPITMSINEIVVGISARDVLVEMQRQSVAQLAKTSQLHGSDDLLARLSGNLIEQRHFFPVFPPLAPESLPGQKDRSAIGANLDLPYLKLGDWLQVRPDLLITPSVLTPFAKVVESVVVVNPGTLSKRRGPGTYTRMTVLPRVLKEDERSASVVGHELYNRARVDVVRI